MRMRTIYPGLVIIALLVAGCGGSSLNSVQVTASPLPITKPAVKATVSTVTPRPTPGGGAADHVYGVDTAYVTAVMYGDFQCDACFQLARTLAVLYNEYPNDLRLIWRHFPQPEDDKASLAAQASEAASAQGRFWEMHDQLFTHRAEWISLTPQQFRGKLDDYAKIIGLQDMAAFDSALDSHKYASLVDKATQEALTLDFKGAPVLLINGLPYSGRVDEFALNSFVQLKLLEKRWYKQPPALQIDTKKHYTATLVTEKGNVVIDLFAQAAPVTVNNFVALARDGWYNNITFHRVVPSQLAQTGDPSGSGFGTAGYTIIDEADNGLHFDREGVVAMASQRGVPNSGSSQFFITYGPLLPSVEYDGVFTIFGQVKQGMDVLRKLTPRDPFDQLRYPNPPPGDKLIRVEIAETS